MHDDGVGTVSGTWNDNPFDVVAGVPLPASQPLAAGVEPLITVIMRAVGSDDLQVQVVDQGLVVGYDLLIHLTHLTLKLYFHSSWCAPAPVVSYETLSLGFHTMRVAREGWRDTPYTPWAIGVLFRQVSCCIYFGGGLPVVSRPQL